MDRIRSIKPIAQEPSRGINPFCRCAISLRLRGRMLCGEKILYYGKTALILNEPEARMPPALCAGDAAAHT